MSIGAAADRRLKKLEAMLERLKRGENVQNRDLRTWLGDDAYAGFEDQCKQQTELSKEISDKPEAVREYERRLNLALFAYSKGDAASGRGKHKIAQLNLNSADTLFERALEHLQEIMEMDPSLCVWFDRDTSWTADSEIGLDPILMPRVVTSRSLDNRGGGLLRQRRRKRELKIDAVECEIAAYGAVSVQVGAAQLEQQTAQLERFLKLRDDEL